MPEQSQKAETIGESVESLKRSIQRLRAIAIVALVLSASSLYMLYHFTTRDSIEAQHFILVDREGNRRGSFGLALNGDTPLLSMLDKENEPAITLAVWGDGDTPRLIMANGKESMIRLCALERGPAITLYAQDQHPAVEIKVTENAPQFSMEDGSRRIANQQNAEN